MKGEEAVRVLLVEDEESHAELVCEAFASGRKPYQVTVAPDLRAARSVLGESEVDIVISDWLLPDGRGVDLLPENADEVRFPLVLMTAHGNEQLAVEAIKAGAIDYVVKSSETLSDMRHVVERTMREWEHITERRRTEKEKDKLEVQLRQSQKMEAIGQLAGGVAHDFNNLLQAIQGYTDLAIGELELEHPAREGLEEVMKASNRAASLVRQLLAFSRRESMEPAHLDLNETIGDLLKMLRRVIGEHIELRVVQGRDLRIVFADPGQVEQILMNLCVNARDAMPDGGRITIETNNTDFETDADPSAARKPPSVLLQVSDTGIGMSPETQERIFEPFFTTKSVGEGTGLGLATVYGIVQRHEGTIEVQSVDGEGSTFRILLPAADEGTKHRRETAAHMPAEGGSETILLAEDEELVCDLAVRVLERAGYDVLVARDGEAAIRLFDTHADSVDLALLDVIMPKKGGRVVAEAIQSRKPDLPILFSTGYSQRYIGTNLDGEAASSIIKKPYRPNDLLEKVRMSLGER